MKKADRKKVSSIIYWNVKRPLLSPKTFQYMENLLNSLEKDLNDIITEKKWDKVSEKYLEKKLKNQYK